MAKKKAKKKAARSTASRGKRAAKKTARKTTRRTTRRKAAKRELIAPRGSKRYVRRDARGRIEESDATGRSLATDRRRKAKKKAKRGQGDRGDR